MNRTGNVAGPAIGLLLEPDSGDLELRVVPGQGVIGLLPLLENLGVALLARPVRPPPRTRKKTPVTAMEAIRTRTAIRMARFTWILYEKDLSACNVGRTFALAVMRSPSRVGSNAGSTREQNPFQAEGAPPPLFVPPWGEGEDPWRCEQRSLTRESGDFLFEAGAVHEGGGDGIDSAKYRYRAVTVFHL
jgi:hypothetical protein